MNKENTVTEVQSMTVVWDGERPPFAKAFVAAQMATEAVKKAATNPAFKSKYADLSEVVEAVVPALNKAGIGVMQFPSYDGELVGVTTVLLHESGASVTGTLHLRPSKSDPQGVGSAVTYGRRYSLLAMTGAAPEDDDGQAASGPRQEPRQTRREEPQESAAVQAAGVAIDLCNSEAVLLKWAADNKGGIEDMSEADQAEVRRRYGRRLKTLRAEADAARKAHEGDNIAYGEDPFEEAA